MKKLVLAMACVLSLALLASCKQAASVQDVNLKNQEFSTTSKYVGTASFTATFMTLDTANTNATTGVTPYKVDTTVTTKSFVYSELGNGPATVSWNKSEAESSNYEEYTITIPYVYNANTASSAVSNLTYGTFGLPVAKIGDDYYAKIKTDSTAAKFTKLEFTEGNPEESKFTLKTAGIVIAQGETISLSNITFERK